MQNLVCCTNGTLAITLLLYTFYHHRCVAELLPPDGSNICLCLLIQSSPCPCHLFNWAETWVGRKGLSTEVTPMCTRTTSTPFIFGSDGYSQSFANHMILDHRFMDTRLSAPCQRESEQLWLQLSFLKEELLFVASSCLRAGWPCWLSPLIHCLF